MAIELSALRVDDTDQALGALREWQCESGPVQLHPGDIGWNWRFGEQANVAAMRLWSRGSHILALGMIDDPCLVRLAIDPDARADDALARRMADDLTLPERGLLTRDNAAVESRGDGALRDVLLDRGWTLDEPWTPLLRDLAEPPPDCGLRVEVVGPELIAARVAVQRASFDRSTFTEELWATMAAGPAYRDARCLLAFDEAGTAVAAATVWSAGPGRPGLLEPLGVHRDHRGHGYGTAISLAAAAALRDMGASSVTVCTPAFNTAAVATYRSAGYAQLPDVADLRRPAQSRSANR